MKDRDYWDKQYNIYVEKKILAYRQYQELKSLLFKEFMEKQKRPIEEKK